MSANPYESPADDKDSPPDAVQPRNLLGTVGYAASLIGVLGLFLSVVGPIGLLGRPTVPIAVCISSACIVAGFLLSLIGVWRKPRRAAAWGIAIGGFGMLYVPTMLISLTRFLR